MNQTDRLLEEVESLLNRVLEIKTELLEIKKAEELSRSEREVYTFMRQGLSRRKIAEALFKSEETIKKQVKSIRRKLG